MNNPALKKRPALLVLADGSVGQGEPRYDPRRFVRQHPQTQQGRARNHATARDERAAATHAQCVGKTTGEPATQRHAQGQRDLQDACVVFARRFTQVQNVQSASFQFNSAAVKLYFNFAALVAPFSDKFSAVVL